ncbi:MAG: hypothetical protein EOP58_05870 [Sphingomonadales bacterium]|nr:MAG: hypothetical protein EOP58_05870 [Sphingomonadales bacterium]
MDFIILLIVVPAAIFLGIQAMVWKLFGKMRPYFAGSVCFLIGVAPMALVGILFGINPIVPEWGIIVIGPTYIGVLLGIAFLLFGVARGLLHSPANFGELARSTKEIAKAVYKGQAR